MRTPDEIKRGLKCCNCSTCPYKKDNCANVDRDALAYIQQLERERDAAVQDIEQIAKDYGVCFCDYCKYGDDEEECAKRNCNGHRNDFEWRGVQEAE